MYKLKSQPWQKLKTLPMGFKDY